MINNNPYIVPQKPLKQSKVLMQPVPLFPHQINRRTQEVEFKPHPQIMKRSTLPIFFESSVKQLPRIPLSPQPMFKGQPLQVSTVSPWENSRQAPNSMQLRELNERINAIAERVDSQERRLITIIDAKKQQHSTSLSDSTTHTYDPGNLFISKQMERYSQFEANCQNSTQIIEKLRSQVNGLKFEREKYQFDLKEHFHVEMQQQKQALTAELINNFRESLNQKFMLEQQQINESIQQIVKIEDAKIEKAIFQLRKQMHNQVFSLRQQFKSLENRQKSVSISSEARDRMDRINNSLVELRNEHMGFKDHVFKSILATHHHEEQIEKIKDKLHQFSACLQKKQISPYEGCINVSNQKSIHQIVRLNLQHYLTAVTRHQGTKTKTNQYNYFIDTQGYLIDAHGYYILNSKNAKIKIEQGEMRMLREMGILH